MPVCDSGRAPIEDESATSTHSRPAALSHLWSRCDSTARSRRVDSRILLGSTSLLLPAACMFSAHSSSAARYGLDPFVTGAANPLKSVWLANPTSPDAAFAPPRRASLWAVTRRIAAEKGETGPAVLRASLVLKGEPAAAPRTPLPPRRARRRGMYVARQFLPLRSTMASRCADPGKISSMRHEQVSMSRTLTSTSLPLGRGERAVIMVP